MEKIVAITGGIGSGKSTALKILDKLGYKSFNADKIYQDLLLEEDFVQEICNLFSIEPIYDNGKKCLNKTAISSIVFKDELALKKLNSITHPKIMDRMISLANDCNGIVFCEVPLLYEGGFENLFDFVIVLTRNDEIRFNSVVKRDGKNFDQVKQIAKNQFNYNKIKQNEHTFIIENDGDEVALAERIKVVVKKIKN